MSKQIIESGLDEISFSVDALTCDTYRQIKGTDNYSVVLKNIFDFIRIRERHNRTTPRIKIKMLATDLVQNDIDLFIRLWLNVADEVVIDREITIWDGNNKRVTDLKKNEGLSCKG